MTTTNLGLNGQPRKFLGAYIKQISTSLGLSSNPSTCTITLAEDPDNGVIFQEPIPGTFVEIDVGPTWHFGGIVQKYEKGVRNIGGRMIQVTLNDPRDVMRSVPMILAPGFSEIADYLQNFTACSLLDIYGAYDDTTSGLNLSGWTDAGMTYQRITQAIHGANTTVGSYYYEVPQQTTRLFGETYKFNTTSIDSIVSPIHRFNSNLVSISDFFEDVSKKHAFDWYVEATRDTDDLVEVTLKTIDRSTDNTDIDLQTWLNDHQDSVVSATSGLELRNDISCVVLQGAPVERLRKLDIIGLANEPIDLVAESGTNRYFMNETEMRVVLAGKNPWQLWLGIPQAQWGGGGIARYGGTLEALTLASVIDLERIVDAIASGNIPRNLRRDIQYILSEDHEVVGKLYEKLKGHAETTYGKRWVHGAVLDDIIESAWTRDTVDGNDDPNEYFRQSDGRTRAYVEFTNAPAGGAFSIGLNNLTNLFGSTDLFRNVTVFGTNLRNVLPGDSMDNSVIQLELAGAFNPNRHLINLDKSNYVYNNTSSYGPDVPRTSLFVAATVDKDGVVRIDVPVLESAPTAAELLFAAVSGAKAINNGSSSANDIGVGETDPQTKIGSVWNMVFSEHSNPDVTIGLIITQFGKLGFDTSATAAESASTYLRRIAQSWLNDYTSKYGYLPSADYPGFVRALQAGADYLEGDIVEASGAAPGAGFGAPGADGNNPVPLASGNNDVQDADGNAEDYMEDGILRMMRLLGLSMFDTSARAYQPNYAYIPTRSKTVRYGPAFPSDLDADTEGRLEIIQDDGFAPWEFGSISAMQEAMQIKVDSASSKQRNVQTASIETEGYPLFNVGDALGKNSNITNITINFGTDGLKTTYNMQSFTKKFGELTKEDIMLSTFFRVGAGKRTLPQNQAGYLQQSMFPVHKNFGGRGYFPPSATNGGAMSFE